MEIHYQGKNGKSLQVDVERIRNAKTGITYNKIEIIEANSGNILKRIKLHQDSKLSINVRGGRGGSGGNANTTGLSSPRGGDGGNGGNGGDTINLSNGAILNHNINTSGGNGGRGGNGASNGSKGTPGQKGEGRVTEQTSSSQIN